MKRILVIALTVPILFLFACKKETKERQSTLEKVPEIKSTIDSKKLRHNRLTDYFTVNDQPILYNFLNLYNCELVKVNDKEYPYRLWIFGESTKDSPYLGYDSIYHARGETLNSWEVYCGNGMWDKTMDPPKWFPVMVHSDKPYDSIHNGDPSVVYKDGKYYMAFSSVGFDNRDGVTYIVNCVMGAVSKDGIVWEKTKAPILIWEKEYEEGWALGQASPPSVGGYHRPSLMWDQEEDKWKIWFDYYLPGTFLSMGYAINNGEFTNSNHWQLMHAGENPQLRDWPNPEVVKVNGKYYAFSDCTGFGSTLGPQNDRQIVMAKSENGWDWTVMGRLLPEEETYGTHIPQAFVEDIDGEAYLHIFYSMVTLEDLPKYSKANYMTIKVSDLEKMK